MGIYSCLGKTLDEVRDALYDGKSGIVFDRERKEMGFRSALTARIDIPDLKGVLSRSRRVYMPEQAKYAYCATSDALKNAGVDQEYLDTHEVGLLYGNDSSAEPVVKAADTMREKKDMTLCGSGAIFQSMNSTVTMNLGCIFGLKGINFTVSGACASGSHAIGLGALLIQNGLQDMVVCGGAQEVNPFAVGSFDGISAFSVREDEPLKASRPFDRDRDGLVPGGGAATVILENYDTAVRRGAPVLAEVLGYGFLVAPGEDADLANIAVGKEYRRRGIAHGILESLESKAVSLGVRRIFLEVRVSNAAAMSLYLKEGFVGRYVRPRYYGDGEDAVVMWKEI